MIETTTILSDLQEKFGEAAVVPQPVLDEVPTLWTTRDQVHEMMRHLKTGVPDPYQVLYDATAIDERVRTHREGQPASDFTVVYHLFSYARNEYLRIKVPLKIDDAHLPTLTDVWPCANWYEREVWDMFGVVFDGHPHLARILMPRSWQGHPLRKDHPARATEMEPYRLPEEKEEAEQEALRFKPEEWGMKRESENADFMFLNVGPQHPGTHGVLRIVLQLDGEEIVD
ncbi:MAG: NADH-quinone oxidoreductase subunit C, partial [Terriglobia bacterium]